MKPLLRAKKLEVINSSDVPALSIYTNVKWYKRIWYWISNPFTYIFLGYKRY